MNALILVDLQNDFVPGGALAVPDGRAAVDVANRLLAAGRFDLVVATQDWHPANHGSFAANHPGRKVGQTIDLNGLPQTLWPVHCVQGTFGAQLADGLDAGAIDRIFTKGTDPAIDSYSGFFDNGRRRSTGLADYLRSRSVEQLYVLGLATDYCVKFTVLDALWSGFAAALIADGCRGVNLRKGDADRAVREMQNAGARIMTSDAIDLPGTS